MSLEAKIELLTAAVEALTAKFAASSPAASTPATTGTNTPAADKPASKPKAEKPAAYTPKYTKEAAQAVMADVKDKLGVEKAKEVRDAHTGGKKITEIDDPKVIDALYEAGKAALTAAEEEV